MTFIFSVLSMSNLSGGVSLWTKNEVIASIFQQIVADERYHGKWAKDGDLVDAIKADFKMDGIFNFTADDLNKVVSTDKAYSAAGDFWNNHKSPNQFNFFKRWYKPKPTTSTHDDTVVEDSEATEGEKEKKPVSRPKVWLYYFVPAAGSDINRVPHETIKGQNLSAYCERHPFNLPRRGKARLGKRNRSRAYSPTNVRLQSYADNLRRIAAAKEVTSNSTRPDNELPRRPRAPTYWESTDAKKLFGATGDELATEAIDRHMSKLLSCNASLHAWKDLVAGSDEENSMTEYQIFDIRFRCEYLALALSNAKEHMGDGKWTWERCLDEAIVSQEAFGRNRFKSSETLRRWFAKYRDTECFPHPNPKAAMSKKTLPPFLEDNIDIKSAFVNHARENLNVLSIEFMHDYVHTTLVPALLKSKYEKLEKELPTQEDLLASCKQELLAELGLRTICSMTVYRWMLALGFRHKTRKKGYYVDGHERKSTRKYRKKFTAMYLKLEFKCYRWIQVPLAQAVKFEEADIVKCGSGYRYCPDVNKPTEEFVEYHIDSFEDAIVDNLDVIALLQKSADAQKYGANLSVRFQDVWPGATRPVMIIGQDECIFKQYQFRDGAWTTPSGKMALIPKDEGAGMMVSGFQSRELGLLRTEDISAEEFVKINRSRQGKHYEDKDAAVKVRKHSTKADLKESPFVVYFNYGANNEGYWTYDHMVLQMEDCVDVLKVRYGETFDYMFLVDHSCGHDRQRPDGLRIKVNSGFGGAQPKMRDTVIEEAEGYLGPHKRDLEPGATQALVFPGEGCPVEQGPWWMDEAERNNRRRDYTHPTEMSKKQRNKERLSSVLTAAGVPHEPTMNHKSMQKLAKENGIPISDEIPKIIEGWEGKAKGMLQILAERGFIDRSKPLSYFTIAGKKDAAGKLIEETSLSRLMENLYDFQNELTLLQHMAIGMSEGTGITITVERTPICHPELAGEGIEYSWGCSKQTYRNLPIEKKKGAVNFRESVRHCLSKNVLSIERIRKFSRRARRYILSYYVFENMNELEKTNDDDQLREISSFIKAEGENITPQLIERMVKAFKAHRCALDFDRGFLTGVIRKDDNAIVKKESVVHHKRGAEVEQE